MEEKYKYNESVNCKYPNKTGNYFYKNDQIFVYK